MENLSVLFKFKILVIVSLAHWIQHLIGIHFGIKCKKYTIILGGCSENFNKYALPDECVRQQQYHNHQNPLHNSYVWRGKPPSKNTHSIPMRIWKKRAIHICLYVYKIHLVHSTIACSVCKAQEKLLMKRHKTFSCALAHSLSMGTVLVPLFARTHECLWMKKRPLWVEKGKR